MTHAPTTPLDLAAARRVARAAVRASLALGIAALVLGLAGCDGTAVVQGPPAAATATAEATPDPDTLVWAVASAPSVLDPARMLPDASAGQIAGQVYDQLLRLRPGTTDLVPGIADDWDADREGRTYTLTVREGLRFHDGTPLDATAVAWNFQRWMDPRHPQHQGEFRSWLSLFGGYVGQQDSQGRATNLIEKVEALDPLTVRLTLREPFAPLLYHLALTPFGIASPTAVRAQGEQYGLDGAHLPVGSGPFRVVSWASDGTVRLAANPDYWAGPPTVPGVQIVVIPDPQARLAGVAGGAVHGAPLDPTTPVTAALAAGGLRVVPRPSRANAWLTVNLTRRPLDDVRVRRALDMAIDRTRLARAYFGAEALPAGQLLAPVFQGFDTSLVATPYDPDGARALLAEAGHAEGFTLNIWAPNAARAYLPDPVGAADAIAGMLREVGIDANVRSEGLRQFLTDRDHGRFTAWIIGWEAQSADPDNVWFFHFGAGRAPSEGQYYNADLAASLLSAQRTLGAAERTEIYQQAARTVARDVARIFLVYTRPLVAVSDRVSGYVPGVMGVDDLHVVTLAPPPGGAPPPSVPTSVAPAGAITTTGALSVTAGVTATGSVTGNEALTTTTTTTTTAPASAP